MMVALGDYNYQNASPLSSISARRLGKHSGSCSHPTSSNVTQRHPTSSNVIQRHPTSTNVTQRHPTSSNVTQHHPTSSNVIQRQPTSPNVIQRQPTSPNVIQRHPTSSCKWPIIYHCHYRCLRIPWQTWRKPDSLKTG